MTRTDDCNHDTKTKAYELSAASRGNMSVGLEVRADATELGLAWSGASGVGSGIR